MRRIDLRALALDVERDPALWEQRKCPKCGTSQIYSGRERGWVHRYTDDQAACSKAKDTFYHAGNLGQESEGQYERMIGFKAGDNVERSGVPGAIYKVLKINGNGSVIIRMFLDAENWDGPMTVVSYDNVIAGRLKKTDKVPRRRAKDVKSIPGMGSKRSDYLRNQEHPTVLGYELDRKTLTPIRQPIVRTGGDYGADPLGDGKFKMVPSGDIVDYVERCRRLAKDVRAKDQVPQDCFDAQILGV